MHTHSKGEIGGATTVGLGKKRSKAKYTVSIFLTTIPIDDGALDNSDPTMTQLCLVVRPTSPADLIKEKRVKNLNSGRTG
jgi:hypothetical protein